MRLSTNIGVSHRVWKISDPGLVNLVRGKMRDKKLIIADGHHRYETALTYRNERRAGWASRSGPQRARFASGPRGSSPAPGSADAPHELVMMTLVNMDSPGMVILPTHRVVHGLPSFSSTAFREGASAYFSVEEVDPAVDAARAAVILREAGRMGTALLAVAAGPGLSSRPAKSGVQRNFRGMVAAAAVARRGAVAQVPARRACWGFRKKPSASRKMCATYETWVRPWHR